MIFSHVFLEYSQAIEELGDVLDDIGSRDMEAILDAARMSSTKVEATHTTIISGVPLDALEGDIQKS